MNQTEIKAMQRRINTPDDGDWGPKSQAALKRHLAKIAPKPSPFPLPSDSAMADFYGPNGITGKAAPPMASFTPPYPLWLYGGTTKVKTISAHRLCADSLEWALCEIKAVFSEKDIIHYGLNRFFGVYNPRRMRAGSRPSKHSWAVAIDIDANRNGLSTHWPAKAVMPLEAIECFAKQGWINLGATINRDAMHFQATK